jgi:alkylation response protein AidB-like acyl-CoA dehydrogenase
VEVPVAALQLRPVRGLDPRFGLVEVACDGVALDDALDGAPQPVPWPEAVAGAQLALAHELVGASRRMLELAREHALDRIQFGVPIASFQAVRHRLAETLVAIETAEAALAAAWDDRSPAHAALAKALAGRTARTTARHCQQVLAGIGFTTEHPLHHLVRRVLVLDELVGSARSLTAALGRELLATRHLPPALPL